MKVLVLTKPEYEDFIAGVIKSFMDEHEIYIFAGYDNFIFDYDGLRLEYEVGISFMYQHKVPAKEVNTYPWFNFHPAPLPEYKGRDLCYHAIMNGEKEFGATLHYMDEDFDTGDIIEVRHFPIQDWWTSEHLSRMTEIYSRQLFEDYLPKILENTVFPSTPNVGGTYYKKGGIEEEIPLHDTALSRWIRAVTYKNFYPKIDIGGVKYKIVREE